MKHIAHIHTEFPTKFGIPRQSGIIETLRGTIVFEPEYRNPEAVRGLDEFSHLWLIWEFSEAKRDIWSPTVRPPRLGGNVRKGVFATRSPFRPNPIGLSSVKLEKIEIDPRLGPVLHVTGADLMDGTPIFDIKPYIAYADSHPDARSGFVDRRSWPKLEVVVPDFVEKHFDKAEIEMLRQTLSLDPRPHYQNDPQKVYGMPFAGRDVRFRVADGVLTIVEIKN